MGISGPGNFAAEIIIDINAVFIKIAHLLSDGIPARTCYCLRFKAHFLLPGESIVHQPSRIVHKALDPSGRIVDDISIQLVQWKTTFGAGTRNLQISYGKIRNIYQEIALAEDNLRRHRIGQICRHPVIGVCKRKV